MKKIYKIAIVGGVTYPIPAIRGGAVQELATAIIEQNEINYQFDITVVTKNDSMLDSVRYSHCDIVEVIPDTKVRVTEIINKAIRLVTKQKWPYKNVFMMVANRYLKKHKFDLVIYEVSDLEMVQVKHHFHEKTMFHVHADYLNNNTRNIDKIGNNADIIVAVSDFIKKQLDTINSFKNKTVVIKNAVDVPKYNISNSNENRTAIRRKLGIKDSDTVFLYCSRLSREKGILELIKAMPQYEDCKLLVVGGENFSSNEITPYVAELKEQASKKANQIIFTGYVDHNDVAKYMNACDVAVIPSICNEAAPLTLVEFRASGLPVIASLKGGIPEYCIEKATEFAICDENFVEHLADKILDLYNNPLKRQYMARFARESLNDYSYRAYFERFSELIINTIEEKNGNKS